MENDRDTAPIACSLEQEELSMRRQRWHALAGRAGVDIVSRENGLRLVLRADRGVEDELRELAVMERNCCAFADWSVSSNGDEVMLDVSGGSNETIAAVQGMLGGLRSSLATGSDGSAARGGAVD